MKRYLLFILFNISLYGQNVEYNLNSINLNINNNIAFLSGYSDENYVKFIEFYGISNNKNIYSYNTMIRGRLHVKLAVIRGLYKFKVTTKNKTTNVIVTQEKIIKIE